MSAEATGGTDKVLSSSPSTSAVPEPRSTSASPTSPHATTSAAPSTSGTMAGSAPSARTALRRSRRRTTALRATPARIATASASSAPPPRSPLETHVHSALRSTVPLCQDHAGRAAPDAVNWGRALSSVRPLVTGEHDLTLANGHTAVSDVLVGTDDAHSRAQPIYHPARSRPP